MPRLPQKKLPPSAPALSRHAPANYQVQGVLLFDGALPAKESGMTDVGPVRKKTYVYNNPRCNCGLNGQQFNYEGPVPLHRPTCQLKQTLKESSVTNGIVLAERK